MNHKWVLFSILGIAGFALFIAPAELRQAIAKYLFFCFIIAIAIRPVGLHVGNVVRKMIRKD